MEGCHKSNNDNHNKTYIVTTDIYRIYILCAVPLLSTIHIVTNLKLNITLCNRHYYFYIIMRKFGLLEASN